MNDYKKDIRDNLLINYYFIWCVIYEILDINIIVTRMWANAQPDGRPAEHRWRPLFDAAKFG